MADDPNRDILPVKEGSCADTINSVIDPRERHLVCKLDRYQLEDKYLRVLDEMNNLKKLSNCQEDKIKRLGTKLIRLAGNPRSCGLALDIADDRTTALELENTKLKEKIAVMRNQLLSHTMSGRSSSRSRNLVRPSSSGLVTCRSENIRARAPSCQCIVGAGDDNNDTQNYLIKIEKLEVQKKDMACRIMELEKELTFLTNNQKEKVAENVEYIRVWRQMKQLNDKLMTTQEKNTALTSEINDLKTTLEQTTRNNQEIAAVLSSERTRMAEIDDQMLKAKNSQFTLREKDEQIRDLMNEIKILQQHNNELIGLTSKYGQVELENVELKKRLSEDAQEQQILKTAFNNEQANIVALKAANEQLLAKLQELQGNIDTLMVQLTSLYTQDKMRDGKPTVPPYTEQCRRCCEMYDKIMQSEKTGNIRENWQLVDKSVQTIVVSSTREQGTMIISNNEGKASLKEWNTTQETNGTNVLSREKILKLLDQAQINTPLDASRIAPKEEYASTLDVAQRHSDSRISSQHDASNSVQENSQKRFTYLENSNITLGQMFLILFDVLQGLLFNDTDKKPSLNCQGSAIRDMLIDSNNNNLHTIITNNIKQHDCSTETTKNFETDYCASCFHPTCKKKSATILTRDIDSSMKNTFDAASFPITHEKYKKSSYRDISTDFCPEKSIKLKRLKPSRYTRCNLTCHLRKVKDPLSLQEKLKLPCKIECLKDSVQLPKCAMEFSPLLITDKQGLIEIHISRLQLSTSVAKIPDEEDICNFYIYVSWDIWDEKTAYTPKMKCPNLIFNSSSVYRIADLFSFFENVLSDYLFFRVNIVRRDNTNYTLARAKVSIKDILDYPQNKLHYIVPVNGIIPSFLGVNFGQLSLWVRLSCNVDMVKSFKKQYDINSLKDTLPTPPVKKDITDVSRKPLFPHSTIPPHVSDVMSIKDQQKDSLVFQDSMDQDTQSLLDSSFQYEIENSDDENSNNEELTLSTNATNKMSKEENGMITVRNLDSKMYNNNEKKENNASRDSPSVTELRTLLANGREKDAIIIEIVSMQLLNESCIMQDDEIQLLYIEYSFLGNFGEDMETVSVEKSKTSDQEMVYNYKKKFWINKATHPIQRDNLRAMLAETTSPNITFTIMSEPLPEEREVKDCKEVGYAIFNLKKYALGEEYQYILLPIKDNQNKQIGTLKNNVTLNTQQWHLIRE
ncbi:uncharacterized protein LOC105837120 isoform X2 [Monomorium pharaonis]|uniref:uncharacterized protein LOC105837120 isoform X2 n=1 Tax=Monomorium pharaonis TaxID=307658 RepID=UPI001745CD4F|nr:uncharacterized protein LOC105837120 isoform X2 [Monomorium pharaonis]